MNIKYCWFAKLHPIDRFENHIPKLIAVLISLLLLTMNFGFTYSQDQQPTVNPELNRWTTPRVLGEGWFQSMVLDQEGNLHVVYYSSNRLADELEYIQRHSDGMWTAPNDIVCTCDTGYTIRNSITVSDDGHLGVTYRDNNFAINFSTALYNVANQPNMWSKPVILGTGYYTNLFTDSDGIIHTLYGEEVLNPDAHYLEDNNCQLCSDVMYRRSTDGGRNWSTPQNLSETVDGSERMNIVQGASSRLYVAWSEGFDGFQTNGTAEDVRLRYSSDQGQTWSDTIILDGGNLKGVRPLNIAVVELRDGSLMAVWRYGYLNSNVKPNFYYQITSDLGKTWTKPEIIPGFAARNYDSDKYDDISLSIDRLGTVHLFAVGSDNLSDITQSVGLFHAEFSQGTWYRVSSVFYRQDEAPEWPRAVIGTSNDIHLTWFTRGDVLGSECNTCNLKVYYSYLPGNMAVEPTRAFRPTLTPLPTATVFQNLEPTTTPFPTLEGITPLTITTADNYAAQTLLGGMLMAALFCGAVVLYIRLRR